VRALPRESFTFFRRNAPRPFAVTAARRAAAWASVAACGSRLPGDFAFGIYLCGAQKIKPVEVKARS
jgi:hypothetical protein